MRLALALVGVALVLLAAIASVNRRALAREALVGWLRSRGVASEAVVEAFGPTAFTARLRVGDPRRPDFTAERAEVRYRTRITGLEVISVTLQKPVLRATEHDGRLSVGALDPIVQEFLRRPPRPTVKQPRIEIDDGILVLATDYGPLRIAADSVVDDGKLERLAATSSPARLKGQAFDVALGAGTVRAARRGDRLDVSLAAPITQAKLGQATAHDGRLTLTAQAPYPDLRKRRGDGALVANLQLGARRLDLGDRRLEAPELTAALVGQAKGWIPGLVVAGRGVVSLRASGGRFGEPASGAIRVAAASDDFTWTRKGGDRVSGLVRLNGEMAGLKSGDLSLASLTATAAGPVSATRAGVEAALTGAAVGRGGWSGLGAPVAADTADLAALKRAARGFRIAAPAVTLRLKDGAVTVGLPQPARLVPDTGGTVELAARPGAPLFSPVGSGFRLTSGGGGLPRLRADVTAIDLADGVTATGRVQAQASLGVMQGGEIDAAGRLAARDGGIVFTAERCAALKAARLEFGANDIEALSGRLCPAGEPLLRMRGGGWRLAGRAEAVTAAAPFAQAKVERGAGRLVAESVRGRLSARVRVADARLEDTAAETRFHPLGMTGQVSLGEYIWRADLSFRQPSGTPVGQALVTHDGRLGFGAAVIDAVGLNFAEGGLQPAQISPLAAALGSPVTGSARFKGRFDWSPEGATSSGELAVPRLDFQSAAGRVEGLQGAIAFSSLAPLTAAPGQQFTVEQVGSAVVLTHLRARFAIADNVLRIEGGEALVGGGRVRIESLETPLAPGGTMRGVLVFEGVQLHDIVEASPFGDKVELDAKVSGRVPFEMTGPRVRVTGGELKAIQPGRLSIDRTALTGVEAGGAVKGPAGAAAPVDPNATFTDFAYQAMENLAFDKLEVAIASREDGRLGVLFHIVGRHDPPQKQRIRLTVMDLVQKRFLGRRLPLPSGTGVNLTLDSTLNLDDLLADFAEYQRLHGSGPVQP